MHRMIVALLTILALLGSATSTLAGPQPTTRSLQPSFTAASDYCAEPEELAFLTLINNYRAQNGLQPLVLTQTLGAASEHHSVDMAINNYFSHILFDGTTWSDNMTNHGYTYNTARGENIAAGYTTASAVFDAWKSSAGHNANMLSSSYNAIGIGFAINLTATYRWYWTTDFGGYVDAGARTCAGGITPTPLPTVAPSATATATRVATNTPAAQPTATNTPQPTPTRTAAPQPTPSNTVAPQPTATSTTVPPPTATWTSVPPTATAAAAQVTYVSSMTGKSATRKGTRTVTVTVKVQDSSGGAVGGAAVTIVIAAPDGTSQTLTATTNRRGQASVSSDVAASGMYLASVTGVSASSGRYDPSWNRVNSVAISVR
jgi:uncharacterized protein YkwD